MKMVLLDDEQEPALILVAASYSQHWFCFN